MLDMTFVRENLDKVRENLERRKNPEFIQALDKAIELDRQWRKVKAEVDKLRERRNELSEQINKTKKAGKDAGKLIKEAAQLPKQLEATECELNGLRDRLRGVLYKIPNMIHESVPYGEDDEENVEVEKSGKKPSYKFKPKSHVDIIEKWGLADLERAAKIAGSRWYFLKGKLAILDLALVRYALDFMHQKGFTPVIPPYMMNRKAYEGVTSLDDFENVMYKIHDEDLYAIATSEHPLTAMYMGDLFEPDELPVKLAGFSTNFRKEAGTHGKDTKGIFRVHQFNKVEQLVVCKPEDSWKIHEQILENAKEFFKSLGLHFRVVNICTGDLGIVAAKKYDIEAWYPVQGKYREVVSCSNCTSYQAARLNIKYQKGKSREYVHTLNATCVATTRAMAAILENFQDEKGVIHIPKVLHKYTGFEKIGE